MNIFITERSGSKGRLGPCQEAVESGSRALSLQGAWSRGNILAFLGRYDLVSPVVPRGSV